jgi:hypothetical protein
MPRRPLLAIVGGLVIALPTLAGSQVCNGFATLAHSRLQVFGRAGFPEGAKTLSGGVTFGQANSFAQISAGIATFDVADASAFTIGGGGGYQVSLDTSERVHVCPTAFVALSFGPNDTDFFGDGGRVDVSQRTFAFAVALGGTVAPSPTVQIINPASRSPSSSRVAPPLSA